MIYLAYILFFPFKIMDIHSMTVMNSPIKAGDTILYLVDYCKYTDAPTTVYRTFHRIPDDFQIPNPVIMSTTTP